MEVSPLSTMPEFTTSPVDGFPGWVEVDCTRCGCTHEVREDFWTEGQRGVTVKTRPCPYCFAASWLPGCKPREQAPRVIRRRKKR